MTSRHCPLSKVRYFSVAINKILKRYIIIIFIIIISEPHQDSIPLKKTFKLNLWYPYKSTPLHIFQSIEGGLGAGSSVLWYILNEKLCNDVVIYLPLCGFSLKIKKNVCLLYSSLKKLEIINIFNIFFSIYLACLWQIGSYDRFSLSLWPSLHNFYSAWTSVWWIYKR